MKIIKKVSLSGVTLLDYIYKDGILTSVLEAVLRKLPALDNAHSALPLYGFMGELSEQ